MHIINIFNIFSAQYFLILSTYWFYGGGEFSVHHSAVALAYYLRWHDANHPPNNSEKNHSRESNNNLHSKISFSGRVKIKHLDGVEGLIASFQQLSTIRNSK